MEEAPTSLPLGHYVFRTQTRGGEASASPVMLSVPLSLELIAEFERDLNTSVVSVHRPTTEEPRACQS